MRTIRFITVLGAAAMTVLSGCTVHDIDQPALAGPSTFAHSIVMVADRDTLTQNGVDFTDIRITSIGPGGQSENIPLRAQIAVDGIPQDFGTLSSKTPITPTTIRYTAPPGSSAAGQQVPTTVLITVTPANAGDFNGEFTRSIAVQLLPQGIILPTNPNLLANFTVTPASPQAFQTATFDASTSTNNGVACLSACSYAWSFGDGTSGTGIATTHQYRTFGNMSVTLTVTDARGASATKTLGVVVTAPTPPTADFDVSPATAAVGQDVFFSARTTSPTGRAIVSYEWNFGDGSGGTGATTTHRYSAPGSYPVVLKVTDDAGVVGTSTSKSVTVTVGGPTNVTFTILPASPRVNQPVTINITAPPSAGTTIASYTINWGDGSPVETVTNPTQSHTYGTAGDFVIAVTATDTLGHSRTTTSSVTVAP